jgi:FixJ family two-component response regulator
MLEIDIDGMHTATELARRHGLKIIIATGFPDTVVAHETVRDLGCALVRKPYTDDELLSAVAACLATGVS